MTDEELCGKLIDLSLSTNAHKFNQIGKKMFEMDTVQGFPPTHFIDELKKRYKYSNDDMAIIVRKYLGLLIVHKIKSGIGDERRKKMIENNKKIIIKVLETGNLD